MTNFRGHIWAWAWRIAHLALRSRNFTKSSPYEWAISANSYLKNHFPKKKNRYSPPLTKLRLSPNGNFEKLGTGKFKLLPGFLNFSQNSFCRWCTRLVPCYFGSSIFDLILCSHFIPTGMRNLQISHSRGNKMGTEAEIKNRAPKVTGHKSCASAAKRILRKT